MYRRRGILAGQFAQLTPSNTERPREAQLISAIQRVRPSRREAPQGLGLRSEQEICVPSRNQPSRAGGLRRAKGHEEAGQHELGRAREASTGNSLMAESTDNAFYQKVAAEIRRSEER